MGIKGVKRLMLYKKPSEVGAMVRGDSFFSTLLLPLHATGRRCMTFVVIHKSFQKKSCCELWVRVSPQNSYAEALIPSNGTFQK